MICATNMYICIQTCTCMLNLSAKNKAIFELFMMNVHVHDCCWNIVQCCLLFFSPFLGIRYSMNHVENIINDWKQNSLENYMQLNFDVVPKRVWRLGFFFKFSTLFVMSDFVKTVLLLVYNTLFQFVNFQ